MEENQNTHTEVLTLENLIFDLLPTEDEKKQFAQSLVNSLIEREEKNYDDDFYFDVLKPMLSSLITIKEDTAKELRYLRELVDEKQCSNEGTEYATEILESFVESINDLLLDYDVEPYRCEDKRFNPRRQNVVKKLIAESPDQVKTVVESLGEGYERKGIVITKERVSAYAAN
jgi:molecular chaperone GrpE (heat shock protein)